MKPFVETIETCEKQGIIDAGPEPTCGPMELITLEECDEIIAECELEDFFE